MLFQGLARRVRGGDRTAAWSSEPLVGSQERIVPCPSCARPLVDGQLRCPGCGTIFLAGVRLRAAVTFILAGCAIGLIGGALVAGVAMGPRLAAGDAAIAAVRAGGDTGRVDDAAPPGTIWVPSRTTAALVQVAAVNDRLAAAATELQDELDGARRPGEIAAVLRRIAANARSGGDAARRLAAWEPTTELAASASGLYTSLMKTAVDGLAAPLANRAAYAGAAREMRSALRQLASVDVATTEAALLMGIELPGTAATP